MARKTPPMKPRKVPQQRTPPQLGMGERGDFSWGVVIAAIIGLVVMVVLVVVFMRSYGPVDQVLSPTEAKTKDSICYLEQRLPKSCVPSDKDKDGDCLADSCDFCMDPNTKAPAKDDTQQQAIGSNLFDKDNDGMPDACDIQPDNAAVSKCEKSPDGKCMIATKHYKNDGKTVIQIASLGTKKETIDDLLIA
ncbi:MAG: hypothetical protein AABX47_04015 [Nanoarchaeota archaeon]